MRRYLVGLVLPGAVVAVAACAAPLSAGGAKGAGAVPRPVAASQAGTWGKAIEVPGTLNTLGVDAVSCTSTGNCGAGGSYTDRAGRGQVFVVSERNGAWGKAIKVPLLYTISCASAGNCAAGGEGASGEGFLLSERNGTWGKAIPVPGTLNATLVNSVSCPLAGNCSAAGVYHGTSNTTQG